MANKIAFNAGVFFDDPARPAPEGTTVTVRYAASNLLVPTNSLWKDKAGSEVLGNPFQIEEPGAILFFADAGEYNITASNGSDSAVWPNYQLIDPDKIQRYETVPITANLTLTAGHLGAIIYTESSVTTPRTITVPSGLGDGFHVSIINRGTSTVTIVEGGGVDVNPPSGGTLVIPASGRASIVECGGANVYDLIGLVNLA